MKTIVTSLAVLATFTSLPSGVVYATSPESPVLVYDDGQELFASVVTQGDFDLESAEIMLRWKRYADVVPNSKMMTIEGYESVSVIDKVDAQLIIMDDVVGYEVDILFGVGALPDGIYSRMLIVSDGGKDERTSIVQQQPYWFEIRSGVPIRLNSGEYSELFITYEPFEDEQGRITFDAVGEVDIGLEERTVVNYDLEIHTATLIMGAE